MAGSDTNAVPRYCRVGVDKGHIQGTRYRNIVPQFQVSRPCCSACAILVHRPCCCKLVSDLSSIWTLGDVPPQIDCTGGGEALICM